VTDIARQRLVRIESLRKTLLQRQCQFDGSGIVLVIMRSLLLIIFSVICVGCKSASPVEVADTIFTGDNILTMDGSHVEAVAIAGDRIIATGARAELESYNGKATDVIELGARALLPGFIDAHGHIAGTASLLDLPNIASPPVGPVESLADLMTVLQSRVEQDPLDSQEWLVAFGYDDSLLKEKRHPTRADLDAISNSIPILIVHVSGHLGVLNSAALKASAISAATPDPDGGVIRRQPGTREPNGVLEGVALQAISSERMGNIGPLEFTRLLSRAIDYYASFGITTIQDGGSAPQGITGFKALAVVKPFPIDIAAYRRLAPDELNQKTSFDFQKDYQNGFRLAGIKISADGSPQGRTAWMTEPYTEGPAGADEDYIAYPTVVPEHFTDKVAEIIKTGTPLIVHTNGDAAIDLLISAIRNARPDIAERDHRTVAIHAQLMRKDQVAAAAELGIVPSFFSAHTFYWGDWHLKSFGAQRGNNISPTGWAKERELNFTIHNDAPVVPPDMMRLVWATVNRTTRSGKIIGAEQRVDTLTALKAITIDAAYQYFEEHDKGSITAGKQADLVILERNPLKVPTAELDQVKVLQTIARGKTVFESNQN